MANKEASVTGKEFNGATCRASSNAVLLTEYRGLTVAQLKSLRKSMVGARNIRRGEEHADKDCC